MNDSIKKWWFVLPIVLGVFVLGASFSKIFLSTEAERCADYPRLNYQLRCQDKPVINKSNYLEFKNDLTDFIENRKREGSIDETSVYFRDLQSGPYFGINADAQFSPASLLKVPLMLAYLRLAEDDPNLLNHELVYVGDPVEERVSQEIVPQETLEMGESYKIDEMLYRSIAFSDNRSAIALFNHLQEISPEKDLLLETYIDLGIIESANPNQDFITTRLYSSIFRVLYNASFLSKEFSSKALYYLSESQFAYGLRQGVPESIPIAHKFGERTATNGLQLHDCGIVYYPDNPYLLCVMTTGKSFQKMTDFIKEISEKIYKEVNSRRNH